MTQTADLIQTPFGADSTAAEVIEGISLHNKRAIVTGALIGNRCRDRTRPGERRRGGHTRGP